MRRWTTAPRPAGRRWLWAPILCSLGFPTAWGGAISPPAWSPDGEWVAYVVETIGAPGPLPTDWIFEGGHGTRAEPRVADDSNRGLTSRHQLWATRVGSSDSVLIDSASGLITAPSWSPDGRALAFGRIVPGRSGRSRYQVVCQEAGSQRTLSDEGCDARTEGNALLARGPVSWSPNGRFLAVPSVRPAGLAVLRLDTGKIVGSIAGASLASWSQEGNRLYYFTRSSDHPGLVCLDIESGVIRRLADPGRVDCPALLSRDGQSLIVLARRRIDRVVDGPTERVELLRVRVEDGRIDRVSTLLAAPTGRDRSIVSTSVAQDRDGENLFSTIVVEGRSCQVTWFRTPEGAVYKNFPALDPSLPIGDLSPCPTGGILALRLGGGGPSGLPVLCDLDSMRLTLLAPDEPARDAWIGLLLHASGRLIEENCPRPIVEGRAIRRPVGMPMIGELEPDSEADLRLRRIGRMGRPLCEGSTRASIETRCVAARLAFDYLRGDYSAAQADLEAIEAAEPSPERRRKLLGLRAQVFAGMGEFERAQGVLGYLKSIEHARSRRVVEPTSRGPFLTDVTPPDAGWCDYALNLIKEQARAAVGKAEDDVAKAPGEHPDPGAPGLGDGVPPVPALLRPGLQPKASREIPGRVGKEGGMTPGG